jgi:hypothetical protein
MGEPVRVLAIDDNAERVLKIITKLSRKDPDIIIENPQDIKSLIQLIEATHYDCIITPEKLSILSNSDLIHKLSELVSIPVIQYSTQTEFPESVKRHLQSFKEIIPQEDTFSYCLLLKRIRRVINPQRDQCISLVFPETPKVVVRGNDLFIVNEEGSEEYWGNEDEENIEEIAHEMELEMKATQWVRTELERFICQLSEHMEYSEIPRQDIPDIVYEGYRSLLMRFHRLHESH